MNKTCAICGQEFETKSSRRKICYNQHKRKCLICGKEFVVKDWPYTQKVCSDKNCKAQYVRDLSNSKLKICEYCGAEFKPTSPRQKYCTNAHYAICKVCGKSFEVTNLSNIPYTCSTSCEQKLREQTMLATYGVSNIMKLDTMKEEFKSRNLKKYGVPYIFQSGEFKSKAKETMLSKYGPARLEKDGIIRQKYHATCFEKYGVEEPLESQAIRSKVSQTIQNKYGVPWYCMTEDYNKFQSIISQVNKNFGQQLEENKIPYKYEKRIENRSYDIELLAEKILLEIDPTITHNSYLSIFDHESNGLDKDYHKQKSALAKKYGYRCIHIFDWDDCNKIIKLFSPKTIIYARECQVKRVSLTECKAFLESHHLQNSCRNQIVRMGLYYHNNLVEIMTFGKPRYNSHYEWELLRLCTKSDFIVKYGAERLFTHFLREYNPVSIISYCDTSKFSGGVYNKIGMNLIEEIAPAKVWSKKNEYVRDSLLRARGYDQLFGTSYGKGYKNEDLMIENGWLPVYDCGQKVFCYR